MSNALWAAIFILLFRNIVTEYITLKSIPRYKRDIDNFFVQIDNWNIRLEVNTLIKSPTYHQCSFYKGKIVDEIHSSATITDCGGQLYGIIRIGDDEFFLEPEYGSENHILQKRDKYLPDQKMFNFTGDTVDDVEFDLESDEDILPVPHVRARQVDASDVQYFRNMMPVSRPVSGAKNMWLELAVVSEKSMIEFYGRHRLKDYILALMNIVSAIFNDPSLDTNITLVITRLYEEDYNVKFVNLTRALAAVNKWNYRNLMKLPMDSTGWDATIWLTRSYLEGAAGYATARGICTKEKSATFIRDTGLKGAFVIAHEIGHLFGLKHDKDDECGASPDKRTLMAPVVTSTYHNFSWSDCSRREFHKISRNLWCLQERSADDGVHLGGSKDLINYKFTMKEQCRMEFGDGYDVCRSIKPPRPFCESLWCGKRERPEYCLSCKTPPLDGTPCGKNKFCFGKICQSRPETYYNIRKEEEDGIPEWDVWSSWSECDAHCGYGLRRRSRHCKSKGLTSHECQGDSTQVATCWTGVPCAAIMHIRADLCRRQNTRLIPYQSSNDTNQCELWCVHYGGGSPIAHGSLPDGASCSYERPFDLCYQGSCVQGHCDPSDSNCNWCPGGYCYNNTINFTSTLGKNWRRITMIPHDAHQLLIHISTPSSIQLALTEKKRDKRLLELSKHAKRLENKENDYLKYEEVAPQNLEIILIDDKFVAGGDLVAAGTVISWNQTDKSVLITANSKLQMDLLLWGKIIYPSQLSTNPLVHSSSIVIQVNANYSTPMDRTLHKSYIGNRWWNKRGPCSKNCGGGVRKVWPSCRGNGKCSSLPRYETCNTHQCNYTWIPGDWEECSATCGPNGMEERQVYCISDNKTISSSKDLIKYFVSPELCKNNKKPESRQPCNNYSCPVYWQEKPWTQCSTTCGRGVSYRPLLCPAANPELCGPKPRQHKRRCHLNKCPRKQLGCPVSDSSNYCERFPDEQLLRLCSVMAFHKHCCNACKNLVELNT